jgi:hypothetical protein
MKQDLDNYLCTTYPKLFVNRNKPMTETCMCWGFECGNGWFNILNQLCQNIQHHLDWKNRDGQVVPQVTVDQVKEKFGTLRFYYTGGDDYISGLVSMAESMSGVTCESCGNIAESGSNGGWVRTICTPCDEQREVRQAKELEEYHAMNEPNK